MPSLYEVFYRGKNESNEIFFKKFLTWAYSEQEAKLNFDAEFYFYTRQLETLTFTVSLFQGEYEW